MHDDRLAAFEQARGARDGRARRLGSVVADDQRPVELACSAGHDEHRPPGMVLAAAGAALVARRLIRMRPAALTPSG